MEAHAFNPITGETVAVRALREQGQPGLHKSPRPTGASRRPCIKQTDKAKESDKKKCGDWGSQRGETSSTQGSCRNIEVGYNSVLKVGGEL